MLTNFSTMLVVPALALVGAFGMPFADIARAADKKFFAFGCYKDRPLTAGELASSVGVDAVLVGLTIAFLCFMPDTPIRLYALALLVVFALGVFCGHCYNRKERICFAGKRFTPVPDGESEQ